MSFDINRFIDQITGFMKSIFMFIRNVVMRRSNEKVVLKNLTKFEVTIIRKYYSKELDEFSPTSQVISFSNEAVSQIVDKLCRRNILVYLTDAEQVHNYTGMGVCYELTNDAIVCLNKPKNKRMILEFVNNSEKSI